MVTTNLVADGTPCCKRFEALSERAHLAGTTTALGDRYPLTFSAKFYKTPLARPFWRQVGISKVQERSIYTCIAY